MRATKELWYVRLPNERVVGTSADVIRQQLADGRLPPGTRVRRSGEIDWQPVERVPEFATGNLAAANGHEPHATVASRLDPHLMRLAGLRPLLEELLGALDSTFVSRKLKVAALAGLLLGAVASLATLDRVTFSLWPPGLGWVLPVAALFIWSWLAVVLSNMTFAEVSRLRPASLRDGTKGSVGATSHLFLAQGIVILFLGGVLVGLRFLPAFLAARGTEDTAKYFSSAAQAAMAAGMVLEILVWPVFALLLPMAALLVVEQCNFAQGLGRWLSLIWRKGRRLLLAELLALAIGLLLTAPLALLGLALSSRLHAVEAPQTAAITLCVLSGLLSSLFLAYLVVANVFIYLAEGVEG